jgi:hypothetical protein
MTDAFRRTLLAGLLLGLPCNPCFADCSLLLLVERDGTIALEATHFAAGETREILLRPRSDVISFILPFGEGKSSDLVRQAGGGALSAACSGEELTVSVRRADGGVRALPPVSSADLARLELRVNLKRGDGFERAFAVSSYDAIRVAAGPVLDLFGGRLPLAPGDWAITLEATARDAAPTLEGEVPLRFDGEHLFATARFSDGRSALFVVDLAAPSCAVRRDLLPPGTAVTKVTATAHGAEGDVPADARPVGLSGPVAGPVARAVLSRLALGNVVFDAVEVTVLDGLPPIGGREIGGLVGLDILRRAGVVEIAFEGGEQALLQMRGESRLAAPALPFSVADRHLFLAGEVGGRALSLVVDTGAKVSLIGAPLARELALAAVPGMGVELRGLDRTLVVASRSRAAQLRIGGESFSDVVFAVLPELAALRSWGLEPTAAVLGNDFWGRFRALEFDFRKEVLRLEPRPSGGR